MSALAVAGCNNASRKGTAGEADDHEEPKFQYTAYSKDFELFAEADPFRKLMTYVLPNRSLSRAMADNAFCAITVPSIFSSYRKWLRASLFQLVIAPPIFFFQLSCLPKVSSHVQLIRFYFQAPLYLISALHTPFLSY